jgi:hypothetical protein
VIRVKLFKRCYDKISLNRKRENPMVTAILIPIICFYFYLVTKKDIKENEHKWINLTNIHEEAIVSGKIVQLDETRKRFYYHRFIDVINIQLQTETKIIQVKRVTPSIKQKEPINLKIGNNVRLYGNWQENEFRFLRYDILE